MIDTSVQSAAYEAEIRQWQQEMDTRLRAEDGWLSLAGLYWLNPGSNTIGANPNADIVLPAGKVPDEIGVIEFADGQATLHVTITAPVTVDGQPTQTAALRDDHHDDGPSLVKIGSVTFFVIRRGDEYGVRIRDTENPDRVNFTGRKWFPINPDYRVQGRFIPHESPRLLQIVTSTGHLTPITNLGRVEFRLLGQPLSLEAFAADEGRVWFVFKDATSGQSTYGAGRFMYAPLGDDGIVGLDFNKAYHPPCAFTPFATCPRPPKENGLTVEITVGERS